MTTIAASSLTIEEIYKLPNTYKAKSPAEAYSLVAQILNSEDGPITSKYLFTDSGTKEVVYEYYRARNKSEKIYVIF